MLLEVWGPAMAPGYPTTAHCERGLAEVTWLVGEGQQHGSRRGLRPGRWAD